VRYVKYRYVLNSPTGPILERIPQVAPAITLSNNLALP